MDSGTRYDKRHLDGLTGYPRPSLAVDIVLLTVDRDGELAVVVIENEDRTLVLPGGFVHPGESPHYAALRVLRDKTGLPDFYLEQLYTFGQPDRDRRGWVVSVAHYALVPFELLSARLGPRLQLAKVDVEWEGENDGPAGVLDARGRQRSLGHDHAEILGMAVKRLRGRLWYTADAFALLGGEFTLSEAQRVFEAIADRRYNTAAFRRRLLSRELVVSTGERRVLPGVRSRPPALYVVARQEV
jgi:8-oxo-dGTP diphosphatase